MSNRSVRSSNSSIKTVGSTGKNPDVLLKRVEDQSNGIKSLANQISKTLPIEGSNIPPRGVQMNEPELNMDFSSKPAENDISFEVDGKGSQMRRTTTGE